MSGFDTTMTNSQFKAYKNKTEPKIDKDRTMYNKEYGQIARKEAPLNAQIAGANRSNAAVQRQINIANSQKRPIEATNAHLWRQRGRYRRGWWARRMRNHFDRVIGANNARIAGVNARIRGLNAQKSRNNSTKANATRGLNSTRSQKQNVVKKITQKNREKVVLIKQTDFYNNRNKACANTKRNIEYYKRRLVWLRNNLVKLKSRYQRCMDRYNKKCSQSQQQKQRDVIANLIKTRENIINDLNAKQKEFKTVCNNKIIPCNKEYDILQNKSILYNKENAKKQKIYQKYSICMDPTKNNCKDKYKVLLEKQAIVGTTVNEIIGNTNVKEPFTAFTENASPYATQKRIHSNYKSNQREYAKLKHKLHDLDEFNKNRTNNTSKYAGYKQLNDTTIYTNILLTAITTSLLYYVIVDI